MGGWRITICGLLALAGEAFDRAQEARKVIEDDGAYFTDDAGRPRAHPALVVERDSSCGSPG